MPCSAQRGLELFDEVGVLQGAEDAVEDQGDLRAADGAGGEALPDAAPHPLLAVLADGTRNIDVEAVAPAAIGPYGNRGWPVAGRLVPLPDRTEPRFREKLDVLRRLEDPAVHGGRATLSHGPAAAKPGIIRGGGDSG